MRNKNISGNNILKINKLIMWTYLFLMFGIFPLYYDFGKKYYSIGTGKYNYYKCISLVFFSMLFITSLIYFFTNLVEGRCNNGSKNIFSKIKVLFAELSVLNKLICSFFALNIITYVIAADKKTAFYGAKGWNMGFLTFVLMLCGFAFSSLYLNNVRKLIGISAVSSSIVFILAVLHRFYIDPLGMYVGIDAKYIKQFLSTVGQTTWYSSYLCILYPIGLAFFMFDSDKKRRVLSGIYSFIAFCTMITQNSDSAFASLIAVMLLLLWFSFNKYIYMRRYAIINIMIGCAFALMGLLRIIFFERSVKLDRLTNILSQSIIPYIWILLWGIVLYSTYKMNEEWDINIACKFRKTVFVVVILIFISFFALFILNSCDVFQDCFGKTIKNNYLYFNDEWGNNRGFNWTFAIKLYKDMPLINKLFGVGQDCFGTYAYSIDEYSELLRSKWGNEYLLCAHNEMLNYLICNGVFGLINYIAIIITGIIYGIKKIDNLSSVNAKNEDDEILTSGVALCILSIIIHNFFCYSQIMCTPYFYIYFGMMNCNDLKYKM